MDTTTDTARRLTEMSDPAAFERIATAVLRAANPLYANLAHPGVQPGGKTVKAPFDNVGWAKSAEEMRFVCAAHTTDQKDLASKWLHDPATVTPRRAGSRPTKPAGDLIKGIAEIEKLRETHPDLAVTFALTTNRETPLPLRVSVETQASAAGIDLDVWSVSRIAHFLDTDPKGQIIRRNCLGLPVKLISRTLLLEMGKRSIADHLRLTVAGDSIRRDEFALGRGDTLVIGSSGMGKTTACAIELDAHIDKGLPAVVLKTEFLVAAPTFEAALEAELRRQEPELEAGAGGNALSLCTSEEPLLVLVEDVNRADSPGRLLNKILSWTRTFPEGRATQRLWRVVCPVWPQLLDMIEDQKRMLADVTLLRVDRYSPAEATRAVCKRAGILGLQMDAHRAIAIADQLGRDPLLIALHDLRSEEIASSVIQTYVEERLKIVASQTRWTRSEVVQALHQLLRLMLQHRILGPRWSEVKSWIADQDERELLRHIARESNVVLMSDSSGSEALEFRHDRVMHRLLSEALVDVLKSDVLPDYVSDPFFAEVVAGAAVQVKLPFEQMEQLMDSSPTVAAHALSLASELDSSYARIPACALRHWLEREEVKGRFFSSQRYAVARILAETTDPHVRSLVAQFPPDDCPWNPLFAAAFRNGDLSAGLTFISTGFGMTDPGKHSLLALVKRQYGSNLITAVDTVLRRVDLNNFGMAGMRTGALQLAGYLGDSSLAQAIRVCWDQDDGRERELRYYLFAAARCCGDDPEAILGPVCDAWDALPEESDSPLGQPVYRVAADHLAWEFRSYTPRDAVRYFVERAKKSKKIGWPITYMLRTVDHPDAVEQLARYAAETGSESARPLKSDWERQLREAGICMSSESKERLLKIAHDQSQPDGVRKQMFAFWEVTPHLDDLKILRQTPRGSLLYERALWARVRRKDTSVISEVVEKISEDAEYWLQISRYLWSDSLTEALDSVLDQLAEEQGEGYTNLEFSVAQALARVEPRRALDMLRSRWAKLMRKPLMVQAALLSTDPEATSMAHEALSTSQDPGALLKHFVTSATINSGGKSQLSSPDQLRNLRPYLNFFSDDEIVLLWDACKKRGWIDFCAQYLEPRMRFSNYRERLSDHPVDTEAFDLALQGQIIQFYHWFDWQLERGATREKVIAAMLDWLSRHDEEKAPGVVCAILSYAATRQELQLFEAALGQRDDVAPWMKSTRFDVLSRSLV